MNKKISEKLNASNIFTVLLFLFLAAVIFIPDFKAELLKGLFKVGLFQPDIAEDTAAKNNGLSTTGEITFQDKSGKAIALKDLKGKVVYINFWTTWCPPCIAEMPSINSLYLKYKNNADVVFLMVDADSNFKLSEGFLSKRKFDFEAVIPQSPIPDDFFSGSLPTTLVLDKSGRVVYRHEGVADYTDEDFVKFFGKLVKSGS